MAKKDIFEHAKIGELDILENPLTAYIMIGLIGSGKTTWAESKISGNSFEENSSRQVVRVSRDDIRNMYFCHNYRYDIEIELKIKMLTFEVAKFSIKSGLDVIADCTNVDKSSRALWVNSIHDADPSVRIIFVHCTEMQNNLQNRMSDPRGTDRDTWARAINAMRSRYEAPSFSEIPWFRNSRTMIRVSKPGHEEIITRETL